MRILQKAILSLTIFTLVLSFGCKTPEIDPEPLEYTHATEMSHAKPYRVLGEGNLANEKEDRTVGLWFIVSEDASNFEEYAHTAIQAIRDLYRLYERDFTAVQLIPNDKLEYAVSYAQANYAADGKGALGMTGSAPAKEMYWRVWATDQPLTGQELAIAELWFEKIPDFPRRDPFSSSSFSYDKEALRQYVADTLKLTYDEVIFPQIDLIEYEYDERL
jgi:hypothetical protein